MRTPDTKPAKTDDRASEDWSRLKTGSATRPTLSATYAIDLQNRFVFVKFTGRVAFQHIEDYALDLRANPRFSPSLSEIIDFA